MPGEYSPEKHGRIISAGFSSDGWPRSMVTEYGFAFLRAKGAWRLDVPRGDNEYQRN